MRGSSLRPVFPLFLSGAGLYPGSSCYFPAFLYPVSPAATYSRGGTSRSSRNSVGVPSEKTPSSGHRPVGCAGYGVSDVIAEVPYHCGISVPEGANDRELLSAGDDLTAHQVWPVEALFLYVTALGSVPDDQAQSSLCTIRRRCAHQQTHHVVFQLDATLILVSDLGVRHYRQIEAADLYCPDGLSELESLDVADAEGPEG